MKRLLFVALVCGWAAVPSLAAPSLGFWEEGDPGTAHMLWNFESANVVQTIFNNRSSFDADTSVEQAFPAGVVHVPIGVAIVSGTNLTFSDGVFSSPDEIDVHLKVNNFPNPNAFKEIWVDVVQTGDVVPTGVIATDGPARNFTYTLLAASGPGADFGWRIKPNPFFEEVEFSIVPTAGGLATLSGIHMDTICIPAPGALLLAGLGAAAVGWLRTRRSL